MATRYLSILVAVSLLQGCGVSWFVPPEEDAVVDEHVYVGLPTEDVGVRALSTKAERRLVLMDRYEKKKSEYKLKVCAESHPEATQSLKSDFELEGKVENIEIAKSLDALETKVVPFFKRSQGLQFYRDGAFQLCQAWMNGLIRGAYHDGEFIRQLNLLRETAQTIILHEVANGFYKDSDDEDEKTETKTETESTTETTSKTTHKSVAKEEKEE